jgi:fumarylacetoacetase
MSSWVEVAADSDFPIQNLPWGVVSRAGSDPFCATIIGEFVINLNALASAGHLPSLGAANVGVFGESSLNTFMGLGKAIWVGVRGDLTSLLSVDGANAAALRDDAALRAAVLCPVEECANLMPATIGDYTDFYASREHATNVGTMFRGVENALQPNWTRLPVGYHGELCSPCERERERRRRTGRAGRPLVVCGVRTMRHIAPAAPWRQGFAPTLASAHAFASLLRHNATALH